MLGFGSIDVDGNVLMKRLKDAISEAADTAFRAPATMFGMTSIGFWAARYDQGNMCDAGNAYTASTCQLRLIARWKTKDLDKPHRKYWIQPCVLPSEPRI